MNKIQKYNNMSKIKLKTKNILKKIKIKILLLKEKRKNNNIEQNIEFSKEYGSIENSLSLSSESIYYEPNKPNYIIYDKSDEEYLIFEDELL